MRALKVDKRMLIDNFTYQEYLGKNDFNESRFDEEVLINNVRVDITNSFSRNRDGLESNVRAVIYSYASATFPFPRFVEQSKVSFDGDEYIIHAVSRNKEPFRNALWSQEIELV